MSDVVKRIADLSPEKRQLLLKQLRKKKEKSSRTHISRQSREQGAFPLSCPQQRLWFLDQLQPNNPIYNMLDTTNLRGEVNLAALEDSLSEIVRRHEALRTRFIEQDGTPRQVISSPFSVSLPQIDLSELSTGHQTSEALRLTDKEALRPFNLKRAPLFRAMVLRLTDQDYILLMCTHHIISDAWSSKILIGELACLYDCYLSGIQSPLEELTIQYSDYAVWQREELEGDGMERQLEYWKQQLAEAPAVLELPSDRVRPAEQSYRGASIGLVIERELTSKLRQVSRAEQVTLYMSLLAALGVVIYRYSGQTDMCIGTPVAGRNRVELEGLIGLFVNTVVMRIRIEEGDSYRRMLQKVREVVIAGHENQEVPFERVVEEIQPERSLSHSPLFQVMYAMQNMPGQEIEIGEVRVKEEKAESGMAMFDLTLTTMESRGGELVATLEYNTDLYEEWRMRAMARHLETVIEAIVEDVEASVSEMRLLSESEIQQVVLEWNDTRQDYETCQCIHALFEEQAERRPQAIAVQYEGQEISYGELNRRANQLAHYLRNKGVGAESLVGICADRSIEMIMALLGVLKSGAAYLPLDPSYPRQRLMFMIEDAQVSVLLTQLHLREMLPTSGCEITCLDSDWSIIAQHRESNLLNLAHPDNLAYIIFTSGTTRKPRGVLISHRNLSNHCSAIHKEYDLRPEDRVLQFASIGFDVAAEELFPTWKAGATVVLRPPQMLDSFQDFFQCVERHKLSVLNLPMPYWHELVSELSLSGSTLGDTVRLMIAGSDKAIPERFAAWHKVVGNSVRLCNAYGPTEATITSTIYDARGHKSDDEITSIPIGRPLANLEVYILDNHLRPVPVGVGGELHIGGDGLSRGYLNNPDLTGEKFIPHSWSDKPGARLYKSGDLARYLPDGQIEFLGRRDDQVKIRGFRIELAEVEAALNQCPAVGQSAVDARTTADGQKALVGYVVLNEHQEISGTELKNYLKDKLPDYMVPSAFIVLDTLPLTPNGKVDRQALPDASWTPIEKAYVAPRTPLEEQLAEIWAGVLKASKVGVYDNFFELGGHSLLATQVISRVRTAFDVEVAVKRVFESPTIIELAKVIEAARADRSAAAASRIEVVSRDAQLPLSYAQRRLWFIDQLEPGSSLYNIPDQIHLQGEINHAALEASLSEIVRRHEVLRTSFPSIDGRPQQVIGPARRIKLPQIDVSELRGEELIAEARRVAADEGMRPFALGRGSQMRASLMRVSAQEQVLLVTMHHIVTDGWSMGVLTREFGELYERYARGEEPGLEELAIQYADYAVWQRQEMAGGALDRQLAYWKQQLADAPTLLELPADRARPAEQSYRGASVGLVIERQLTNQLRQMSRSQQVTLYMSWLAALGVVLYRYSGQTDLCIGTPVAGRGRVELEGLIGLFVNTVVMRLRIGEGVSYRSLLAKVREVVIEGYENQEAPFERVVEEVQPDRSLSHSPLFQVMYSIQNMPGQEIEIGEVRVKEEKAESGMAMFDLKLTTMESRGGELVASLEYNTDLYEEWRMRRMARHLERVIEAMVENVEASVSETRLLSESEIQQLVVEWNDTRQDCEIEGRITDLFRRQVERTPHAVAVSDDDERLTYRQLQDRVDRIAAALTAKGVGPEGLTALISDRNINLLASILAVFQAGGAYLPLDPQHPANRITQILNQSQAGVILVTNKYSTKLADAIGGMANSHSVEVMRIEAVLQGDTFSAFVSPRSAPTNLSYVIYTSGSTGVPKGAMIEQRGMLNHLFAKLRDLQISDADVVAQTASQCFDISVWQFLVALLVGGRVHIVNDDIAHDPARLLDVVESEGITILETVPALLRAMVDSRQMGRKVDRTLAPLRWMLVTGEALPPELCRDWLSAYPTIPLLNAYGPTECSDDVTHYVINQPPAANVINVSIGRPIINTAMYVLDGQQQLMPAGIPGELHVGGKGVGRGYLFDPLRTAEVFVPNPFATEPGERLYRTGDLARYSIEGNSEYLGRIDHQVKVRGFRIELGEIEAVLAADARVKEVVVMAREDAPGDKRLVAYVVPSLPYAGNPLPELQSENLVAELRALLRERVPDYMIPAAFVLLDAMPLNSNGKLDRRKLPVPVWGSTSQAYEAPRTPVEELLAGVWRRVLNIEKVGIHDNFFGLGGDSILSIQIVAKVNQAGLQLSVRQVFQYQTIAALAEVLGPAQMVATEQGIISGAVALTPVQHDLIDELLRYPDHPDSAMLIEMRQPADADLLRKAADQLLDHHEALRLRFAPSESGWQPFDEGIVGPAPFIQVDLSEVSTAGQDVMIAATAEALRGCMRLSDAALVRFVLFDCGAANPGCLLIAIHKLLADANSLPILMEDFESIGHQLKRHQSVTRAPRTTSFRDWLNRLQRYADSDELRKEMDYWLDQSRFKIARLPLDDVDAGSGAVSVKTLSQSLSATETTALLEEVPAAYRTTINDVLHTALAETLAKWTDADSFLVELSGSCRDGRFDGADLSRSVGRFDSRFPVRLTLPRPRQGGDALKAIKEQFRAVANGGVGYGLLRYSNHHMEAADRLANSPQAEVRFSYLGQFDRPSHSWARHDPYLEPAALAPQPGAIESTRNQGGKRDYALEIISRIRDGELQISWVYNENRHRRSTIESLAQEFVSQVRAIMADCLSPAGGGYTPSDFPLAKLTQPQIDSLLGTDRNIEDVYALTPTQEGMLYHALSAPDLPLYFRQTSFPINPDVDISTFEAVWNKLVERHAVFRTAFFWEGLDHPVQVVYKKLNLPIEHHDWRHLSVEQQRAQLQGFLRANRNRRLDFSTAPVMRMTLIRMTDRDYQATWNDHHILFDGWSQQLLLDEMLAIYWLMSQGKEVTLSPAPPYRNYIEWLQKQDMGSAEAFWRESLRGFTRPTPIPMERSSGAAEKMNNRRAVPGFILSEELTARLNAFARQHQVTLNSIIQGLWALLLSRYSGAADVVFGATVSGRPAELAGVESIIGLFINTLPVRARLSSDEGFLPWVQQLQREQSQVRQYEYTPLAKVRELSEVPHNVPLFESILVFQNLPENLASEELTSKAEGEAASANSVFSFGGTGYSLTVVAMPDRKFSVDIGFDPRRFDYSAVARIAGHLRTGLESVISNPDQRLGDVQFLTEREQHQLFIEWNDTRSAHASQPTVHQSFEAQVRKTPDSIAIASEHTQITYRELNERANQLARRLRFEGAGTETLVAICMDQSVELIIGLLAILKADAVCVPLDPACSDQWLESMLTDAKVELALTQHHFVERFAEHGAKVICLDADSLAIAEGAASNLSTDNATDGNAEAGNLAYVSFSSGYAGTPRAVAIEHRSAVDRLEWAKKGFGAERMENVRALSSISSANSLIEILAPLTCGGTVILAGRSLDGLYSDAAPTLINTSPSALADSASLKTISSSVRAISLTGEPTPYKLAQAIFDHSEVEEIWNLYGQAETAAYSTYTVIRRGRKQAPSMGRPVANTQIHLLDSSGRLVPVGMAGEVYISGDGLARGYLNRPELTAEKFIPNPFAERPGSRLYRTGDLARYRPDGEMEFLSRGADVVEIAGHTFTLASIESVLRLHPLVKNAIVVARENQSGARCLVAYLTCISEAHPASGELKNHLATLLPDFMIPARFNILDAFTLTHSGRIDRQALPEYEIVQADAGKQNIPPRDLMESQLAEIWEDILLTQGIGVTDNFFELGGSSLLALRLVAQVQQKLDKRLPLETLIKHPTIEYMADVLRRQVKSVWSPLVAIQQGGAHLPLFCVHAIEGYVAQYMKLGGRLGPDQPCYGLQARGLEAGQQPHESIPEMAACYIEAIRTVQPEGPYLLCGASSGGLIALEMAQQLRAHGERVALLTIFDTGIPKIASVPTFEAMRRRYLTQFTNQYMTQLGLSDSELEHLSLDNKLSYLLKQAQAANLLPPGLDEARVRQLILFNVSSVMGWLSYVAQPYDGLILLFRAIDELSNKTDDQAEDLGWGEIARGGLEIEYTPGEHSNQILEPHVKIVAERLAHHINQSLSE